MLHGDAVGNGTGNGNTRGTKRKGSKGREEGKTKKRPAIGIVVTAMAMAMMMGSDLFRNGIVTSADLDLNVNLRREWLFGGWHSSFSIFPSSEQPGFFVLLVVDGRVWVLSVGFFWPFFFLFLIPPDSPDCLSVCLFPSSLLFFSLDSPQFILALF